MKQYNFIKFTKTSTRTDDRISISKSNSFGLTRDFRKNQLSSEPRYVVVYYDVERSAIGLHFTDDESEKHRYKVSYSNKYGANIGAASFFRVSNLAPLKIHGKYQWDIVEIENIGKLYVVQLHKEKMEGDSM